jgi:DNA-binding response OmpR family regulator
MLNGNIRRILVVDDEPDLRQLLVDTLGSEGAAIAAVGTAREALAYAAENGVDLVVADVRLGDGTGLELIDRLRRQEGADLPALVITGHADAHTLTEASRRRPVEMMTKPLNLERLRLAVRDELARRDSSDRLRRRNQRLRLLARSINRQRKEAKGQLDTQCAELAQGYRSLCEQLSLQQVVMGFQNELIAARTDDEVFANLFRLFATRTGLVFGVALVCNENAELRVVGRFGAPRPDALEFCERLAEPVVNMTLAGPRCMVVEAGDHAEQFDPSIRRALPGLSMLAIPLIPSPGELIGLAMLYRKGEQPFTSEDLSLAEMVAFPAAACVRRND